MQWRDRRESGNVVDLRRYAGPSVALGGGSILLIFLLMLFGGEDVLIEGPNQHFPDQQGAAVDGDDELKRFVAVVLADTEDVWHAEFEKAGSTYREPKLALFSDSVRSGCGHAGAAIGPFYCPEDETIYVDLDFFHELKTRFGAPGDFAQAYVIAHEVGHHVQKLWDLIDGQREARSRVSQRDHNRQSVRIELQADFLAGFWAHHAQRTKQILDPGDLEEALQAANAIGDDRLQRQSQGYVIPDSFTHGTSEQRIASFRRGFTSGDLRQASGRDTTGRGLMNLVYGNASRPARRFESER